MLSVVHVRPDGTESEAVTGPPATIIGHVAGFDWQAAAGDGLEMPRLDIRRDDDGDLFTIEHDASSDTFQCSLVMTVPQKLFGVSSYLWSGFWESDAIMLDRETAIVAVAAFCDKDLEKLRGMWEESGAP